MKFKVYPSQYKKQEWLDTIQPLGHADNIKREFGIPRWLSLIITLTIGVAVGLCLR